MHINLKTNHYICTEIDFDQSSMLATFLKNFHTIISNLLFVMLALKVKFLMLVEALGNDLFPFRGHEISGGRKSYCPNQINTHNVLIHFIEFKLIHKHFFSLII